jgi:peptidoglycan/LPS O-acetylase OafA/YrhL
MHPNTLTAELLQPKKHFAILDGLRGVAALAVVIFHFMEWVSPDYSKNFIGHGYLAVDFFFCLSGFVIGYAYDSRIKEMGIKEFFKSRLIRLHPLVVLGAVLGILGFLFDPFADHTGIYSAGRLALIFACTLLLIPFPVMEDRYFNLFGLNAPAWSLFWEYVANIVYALVLCRLNRKVIAMLTAAAALAICYVAYRSGTLSGGWGKASFWDGSIRVSFSFLAGLLIYRYSWIIKNRIGFIGLALLLSVAFLLPYFSFNWIVEALLVLLYFPLIVALGAGSVLSGKSEGICNFSGRISYPLYMTHYFFIWIFASYFTSHPTTTGEQFAIISVSTLLLVGLAYLALIAYDAPIRKYLTKRRMAKK